MTTTQAPVAIIKATTTPTTVRTILIATARMDTTIQATAAILQATTTTTQIITTPAITTMETITMVTATTVGTTATGSTTPTLHNPRTVQSFPHFIETYENSRPKHVRLLRETALVI